MDKEGVYYNEIDQKWHGFLIQDGPTSIPMRLAGKPSRQEAERAFLVAFEKIHHGKPRPTAVPLLETKKSQTSATPAGVPLQTQSQRQVIHPASCKNPSDFERGTYRN